MKHTGHHTTTVQTQTQNNNKIIIIHVLCSIYSHKVLTQAKTLRSSSSNANHTLADSEMREGKADLQTKTMIQPT